MTATCYTMSVFPWPFVGANTSKFNPIPGANQSDQFRAIALRSRANKNCSTRGSEFLHTFHTSLISAYRGQKS